MKKKKLLIIKCFWGKKIQVIPKKTMVINREVKLRQIASNYAVRDGREKVCDIDSERPCCFPSRSRQFSRTARNRETSREITAKRRHCIADSKHSTATLYLLRELQFKVNLTTFYHKLFLLRVGETFFSRYNLFFRAVIP